MLTNLRSAPKLSNCHPFELFAFVKNQVIAIPLTSLPALKHHQRNMSNRPQSTPTPGTPFAPRALVPINVGRSTVNLHPIIDQTMLPHERAHAFHINKTALSSQSIDLHVQLNAFGHQLNLSAMVDGLINNWFWHFYDRCFDFGSLVILSFHNRKGNQVNDMTNTTDPSVLLAMVDDAVVNCCKNVKFARIHLSVNFINLLTVADPGPTTL
jgi:hypothetical protein